ncbi:hypothetical protein Mapa_014649 [Marchantia paleacea]|nr:hypothetical protein Mapa_014649 [Marchantia paleacea]
MGVRINPKDAMLQYCTHRQPFRMCLGLSNFRFQISLCFGLNSLAVSVRKGFGLQIGALLAGRHISSRFGSCELFW